MLESDLTFSVSSVADESDLGFESDGWRIQETRRLPIPRFADSGPILHENLLYRDDQQFRLVLSCKFRGTGDVCVADDLKQLTLPGSPKSLFDDSVGASETWLFTLLIDAEQQFDASQRDHWLITYRQSLDAILQHWKEAR